jgi:ankyrin repeat protein
VKTWYEHLREGEEGRHLVQHHILLLFQNATKFKNWVSIWNVDDYFGEKPIGKLPLPIYYASYLELDFILSKLLSRIVTSSRPSLAETSSIFNAEGGHYGNALQAASAEGLEAVVRLLLDKGADAHAEGGRYGNALQAASTQGHEAIVRLLLERGANTIVAE